MKKSFITIIFVFFIILFISACFREEAVIPQLKDGVKLNDIVTAIHKEIGISMPISINDAILTEQFHINKEDITEYAGMFSISATSADGFIIVKPALDKYRIVKKALEQRKQDVIDMYEQYLPDEYKKAKSAKIIEKGDYLIYMCIGTSENGSYEKSLLRADEIITSYFK